MIVTKNKVKTILGYTDTTNDNIIDIYIPIIEEEICKYCNNHFLNYEFNWINSSGVSFVSSDNSINKSNIINDKIVVGDDIRIYGSLRNNGVYTVDSITTDKIIVNSINEIKNEDENKGIIIATVNYPTPLQLIASQMIGYTIDKDVGGIIKEKLNDYSMELSDTNMAGYPQNIISQLKKYRCLYLKAL